MRHSILPLVMLTITLVLDARNYSRTSNQNVETLKRTNKCVNCDFSGLDLAGLTLDGADLSGSNFSRGRLPAIMRRVNLTGANMQEAELGNGDYSSVNLSLANLCQANIFGARWYNVNLSGASWISCMNKCSYNSINVCKIQNCAKHMETWPMVECW